MNSKRVNWLFLTMVGIQIIVSVTLAIFWQQIRLGIVANMIISQLMLALPALVFLVGTKANWPEMFAFRKIKTSTALMIVIFTYLLMPLVTVVNAISMLFTRNVVTDMSGEILKLPFMVSFFLMAILGPTCEELVFRGVIQSGLRKSGSALQAIIGSAFLFGFMHMNFNQALYAIVLGIVLALLKEVTGSILAPILLHIIFNGNTTIMLYLTNRITSDMAEISNQVIDKRLLMITICVYAIIALITTAIAGCVLVWIANNEGRKPKLQRMCEDHKREKGKQVTIPLILGIIICLGFMIWTI